MSNINTDRRKLSVKSLDWSMIKQKMKEKLQVSRNEMRNRSLSNLRSVGCSSYQGASTNDTPNVTVPLKYESVMEDCSEIRICFGELSHAFNLDLTDDKVIEALLELEQETRTEESIRFYEEMQSFNDPEQHYLHLCGPNS
eukprot:Tbor_TRINITY_DN5556_c0_g2::TRINITY_DN5556_c0_g2_i1::g.13834::m.13834